MQKENYSEIISRLACKASLKQEIYRNTVEVFSMTKKALSKLASRLHEDYSAKDPSVEIAYRDSSQFEAELKFSGDMLLLSMHSNVFNFEEGHRIYQSSYIKANPSLSYCGVIYIHNFLADSIKYNRLADEGTLIARVLINKEKHFMVEGERQLSFFSEAFSENEVTEEVMTDIIERSILDCLDNDLQLPPYSSVRDITLYQKQSMVAASGYPTSKRLGYLFKSEMQQLNQI